MAKILKAENIQTDVLGSNGDGAFSLQRNNSSLLTLYTNDYVGVNTTAPSHLFEVRGSSTPKICITSDDQLIDQGATFRIDLKNASSSLFEAGTISIRHTASNQTAAAESSYMSFFTRNAGTVAEKMRILNTGSVGIGTTSPAARLHVAGGSIRLDDDYSLSWGGTANGVLGSNASNYLRFSTNGAVAMVIDNNGDVGIGTTNPARLLTVDNATSPEIALYTAGTERVKFSTGGSAQSVLAIDIGGTPRFIIDSSGNVGVGTTSPATQLQINSSAATYSDQLRIRNTNFGNADIGVGSGIMAIATDMANIAFYTSSNLGTTGSSVPSNERLRIDSSGNVGIGTTSPAYKLTVQSDGTGGTVLGSFINSTVSNNNYAQLYLGKGVSTDNCGTISYVPNSTSSLSTLRLGLYGSSDTLSINGSGNVGIGTTSPTSKLHVSGTANITGNLTLSVQSYFVASTITNSGGSYSWDLNTNQVARLTLNGNKTLNNPTNQNAGAVYILIVTQSSSGSNTLAFDTAYKFPGGVTPTISITANKVDVLTFVSDGTNMLGVATQSYL
jgi:hypothetical protein